MADLLELRYIPISQAELFGNNAKLHNLDQIISSITKYGFKSAAKWESALNDGRGGIVAGNGRVEALRVMKERGDDCPIGIALSNAGEWCVPVLFGVESSSEVVARAYAFDDNNLTLLGGNFDVADLLGLYDQELLMSELEELARLGDLPITIMEDEFKNLLAKIEEDNAIADYDWNSLDDASKGESGGENTSLMLKFSIPSDKKDIVLAYLNVESEKPEILGKALILLCEN